jgi:HK97 gp10 family phage protein
MANAKLMAQLKALENIPWVAPVAAAERIAELAQEKAPIDTGFLQSMIIAVHFAHHSRVEAKAPYSGYQEFGTYKMKAQPFMRPAIDEGRQEILNAVAEAMIGEINVAVKGGWVPAEYKSIPGRPKARGRK